MSKNKYKNNEPLNKKNVPPADPTEADQHGNGKVLNSSGEAEEDPILLSEWADPETEEPLRPLEHPEIARIPDYREHISLTEPEAIDVIRDRPIPSEPKHYPEAMVPESRVQIHDGRSGRIDYDADSDPDSRYYAEPIDPYTGEKTFADHTGGEADRLRPEGDSLGQHLSRPGGAAAKGFPWWWILLPLILLGLIYGLTRPPATPVTPPASTTTVNTTARLPREAISENNPVAGSYFLGL